MEVRSQYYPEQSNPLKDQYIFVYKVKITNQSSQTVQLVSRTWEIKAIEATEVSRAMCFVVQRGAVRLFPGPESCAAGQYRDPWHVSRRDGRKKGTAYREDEGFCGAVRCRRVGS